MKLALWGESQTRRNSGTLLSPTSVHRDVTQYYPCVQRAVKSRLRRGAVRGFLGARSDVCSTQLGAAKPRRGFR